MSKSAEVGFVAIYRWRVHPEKREQFQRAWFAVTQSIKADRGGLGSRLHQADDGTFVAYAQWPNREMWLAMSKLASVNPEASKQMREAIEEILPSLYLDPISDLLEH